MGLGRSFGQHELLRDLTVRPTSRDEASDLDLAPREATGRSDAATGLSRELVYTRRETGPPSPPTHLARRLQEVRGDSSVLVAATPQARRGLVNVGTGDPDVGSVGAVARERALSRWASASSVRPSTAAT